MKTNTILDEKTFREFTIFNILSRYKYWRSPAIFASILTVSAIICFISKADGSTLLGTVLLIIALGLPTVYFTTFFSNLKKETKKQNLGNGRYVYSLDIKDSGVEVSNEKEKAEYKWKMFFHAYRAYDCIYLFITRDKAFLLPFPEETLTTLWSIIERNMAGRTTIIKSKKTNERKNNTQED